MLENNFLSISINFTPKTSQCWLKNGTLCFPRSRIFSSKTQVSRYQWIKETETEDVAVKCISVQKAPVDVGFCAVRSYQKKIYIYMQGKIMSLLTLTPHRFFRWNKEQTSTYQISLESHSFPSHICMKRDTSFCLSTVKQDELYTICARDMYIQIRSYHMFTQMRCIMVYLYHMNRRAKYTV